MQIEIKRASTLKDLYKLRSLYSVKLLRANQEKNTLFKNIYNCLLEIVETRIELTIAQNN